MIRIVLHSSAPGYSVSFSLSAPLYTEVNMISDPNPLLDVKHIYLKQSQLSVKKEQFESLQIEIFIFHFEYSSLKMSFQLSKAKEIHLMTKKKKNCIPVRVRVRVMCIKNSIKSNTEKISFLTKFREFFIYFRIKLKVKLF